MERYRSETLGVYQPIDRHVLLTVAVETTPPGESESFDIETDVDEWALVLHVESPQPNGTDTEVAVIDTAHGAVHFDRYFTHSPGQDKLFLHGWSFSEAKRLLLANWREYVSLYQNNHGFD